MREHQEQGKWDHPRACGEKCSTLGTYPAIVGSPPRVRGKDAAVRRTDGSSGITPARAGKRVVRADPLRRDGDHPRACGEKTTAQIEDIAAEGSPPRVRGKEEDDPMSETYTGITPARAGKSFSVLCFSLLFWDHPRACGEKKQVEYSFLHLQGSPPRVRGKAFVSEHPLISTGITPARAGKSRAYPIFCSPVRDHPRACGEKSALTVLPAAGRGSPPRVRGNGTA